jgi:putative ABC transport system ATP-binding protein
MARAHGRHRRHDQDDPHAPWRPGYQEPAPPDPHRLRVPKVRLPRRPHRVDRAQVSAPSQEGLAGTAIRPRTDRGPLIEAKGVVRTYPGAQKVTALRGVDLSAGPGEFVALLGPSGSGKTTLLGILAGLDRPEEGTVRWEERSVEDLRREELLDLRRHRMGIVFQGFGLLPTLSAAENVELPLRVAGVEYEEGMRSAEAMLTRLGLGDRFDNRVFELSAGQQQRVAVARALVIEPDVVLADEPIAEVDTENAEAIMDALAEVSFRGGAVICATHNPVALRHATRAVLLRDGRIEASGTPDEVAARLTTD